MIKTAFDLSGGWGVNPNWLKMTPKLVTENFCLGGRKVGEREGNGKREGKGGEGPHCFFGQIEPWIKSSPTDCENLNFTDVQRFVGRRKLDDNVSEEKSLFIDVSTLDTDSGSVRYSADILSTQRVVPQNRCAKPRIVIS